MVVLREFLTQRLIIFLLFVLFLSGGVAFAHVELDTWVMFLAGIAFLVIMEYVIHRFVLHEFPEIAPGAYRGHVEHHENPQENKYLFGPIRYDFCVYAMVSFICYMLTQSYHLTAAFMFGTVAAQLLYQWAHLAAHRPLVPLTPLGKWMKKKHLLHHHLDEHTWYGVSNPILDVLLGTNNGKRVKPDIKK